MSSDEIFKLLQDVLVEHHDVARELIKRETPITDLGFDSLSMTEVTYQMEVRLGIPSEQNEPRRVPNTIGEVAEMIAAYMAERSLTPQAPRTVLTG